jgi:acetyl-CoA acyltransferase
MGFRLRAVSLHADSDRTISGVAEHLAVAWAKDTGADLAKTNVNGGAIAIGHPLGASGARIMATLVNALEQRDGRYGLQTMCEGGGVANATIIERLG